MTLVKSIRVQNVRTHRVFSLQVSPSVTTVTGPNGAGKTSLVEALYIALQGTSFKGSDKDVLRHGADWYRIDVQLGDGTRTVKFEPERMNGRKQFITGGKTQYRLGATSKYPVVLFEPDDLRLLGGSPTRRRQFLDRFIGQIDPKYGLSLRRYERALKQRNALLKRPGLGDNALFAWNVSLSEYGAYIIEQRIRLIEKIQNELPQVYATIAGTGDEIAIRYSHLHANSRQRILADLHAHIERDKALGYTSTGPHRHDVLFDFNGSAAMDVASRGEIRSIILALKFIEVHLTENALGRRPIILLDDVFSELDATRQKNLVTEFTDHQIVITSVEAISIKGSAVTRLKG